MFTVCTSLTSCTSKTTIGTGSWLGSGELFTVVDTPGFGDSSDRDVQFIQDMMDVLNNDLGYTHSIMLVVQGSTPRFSSGLQAMIKQMTAIFGASWWDFLIIGVSKWSYSQAMVDLRKENCEFYPDDCRDEAWFKREFSQQINETFGIDRTLTFVFTEAFSQTTRNKGDVQQQKHWRQETDKIWQFMRRTNEAFKFLTIDEILNNNNKLREKVAQQEESIDQKNNNIAELRETVLNNNNRIDDLQSTVSGLTATLGRKNQTIDELKNVRSTMEAEVETLKGEQNDLEFEKRSLEEKLRDKDKTITQLKVRPDNPNELPSHEKARWTPIPNMAAALKGL